MNRNGMTLEQINDSLRTVGEQVNDLSSRLALAATQETPNMDEVTRLQNELQQAQTRLNALRDSARAMGGAPANDSGMKPLSDAQMRTRKDICKSNEYARAFAFALRNGLTPATGAGREETKVLYDALTIGGGNPTGADGGFLVPEDVNHMIREKQRALNPLRELFAVEQVTTQSGWRVTDAAPTTGFSQVNEMATVPSNAQPVFGKVPYSLVKYGLILPVSNELLADEVANLLAYIARWGAKKETITENTLLVAALNALSSAAVTIRANSELKDIKKILNVSLDPAISRNAAILTNQDGFNLLDSLEDLNGRPLLQWDPVSQTPRALGGRRVKAVSNATLANIVTGEGQSAVTSAPFFFGDGEEFATLFERESMEVVSTNIGGTSFTTDSTQIRFIKRMGVSTFDTEAMVMGKSAV